MIDLRKQVVLALLLLGCAGVFNSMAWPPDALQIGSLVLPPDAFCAGPESSEPLFAEAGTREAVTVDVIGRGTIDHDDVAKARSHAIEDALQGVVEEAVGLVISPASVVEDFQLLSDQIYNQTEAFINDYKVLTEAKSGRYYRVVVRATVSMSAVRDTLQSTGVLMTDKGLPTVIFFVSEQNIGESSPKYWWGQAFPGRDQSAVEKTLVEYMREKGFVISDRSAVGRDMQLAPEYMDAELSDDAAANLGKELGADVVIVGKGVASFGGSVSDTNMKSIQARLSARAIRTDTKTLVASSQGTKGVIQRDARAGATEALTLAASAVAEDLTRQILAKWRQEPQKAVLVELVVKGIREYADFVRFRQHLKNDIRGVRNIYLRNISVDGAKMDVDFMGNAKTLADDLVLQPFNDLSVKINEVSEQVVKLELIPSPAGAGFHE